MSGYRRKKNAIFQMKVPLSRGGEPSNIKRFPLSFHFPGALPCYAKWVFYTEDPTSTY